MSRNDVAIFLLLWTVRLASGAVKTRVFIGKSRKNIFKIVNSLIIINRHLKRGAPSKVCLINLLLLRRDFFTWSPIAGNKGVQTGRWFCKQRLQFAQRCYDKRVGGNCRVWGRIFKYGERYILKTIDFLFACEVRQPGSNVDLPRKALVFWWVKILSTVTEK